MAKSYEKTRTHFEASTADEQVEAKDETAAVKAEHVLVLVPHAFILTDNKGHQHRYATGNHMMPLAHAEHPYTIANGVKQVEK